MGGLTSPLWFPFVNALPGKSGLSDLLLGRDAFWFDLAVNLVAGRRRRDQPGPEVVTQLFGRRRAAQDPLAVRLTKTVFHAPRESHPVIDTLAQGILFESDAKFARMDAFLAKRAAKGRQA